MIRDGAHSAKPNTGLNICTIIDLRNTDEIVAAYKYRTYEGAVSLYSFFRIVLDTATSLRMKADTKSFYARSFDSVMRDLHYAAASTSYFADGLYQSSPSPTTQQSRAGRAGQCHRVCAGLTATSLHLTSLHFTLPYLKHAPAYIHPPSPPNNTKR